MSISKEALRSWNLSCIYENLSPGGAADILAAAIF
ncbi:triphosphoribosyl-dephospho-CoA synthase [Agathobacter sp.]